jgi:hypothetical protein
MYSPKRRFRLFRLLGPSFPVGPPPNPPVGSSTSILAFSRTLATTFVGYNIPPTNGGTLTVNSQSMRNYEVTARRENTTISSFVSSDWFTNTKDTTSSWIIVNGDLTINAGQTIIPPARKLFTVVYVTGNLICNGSISMTARGANHSGDADSGGSTSRVDIRIGTGTFSGVLNPQIPATGGSRGSGRGSTGQTAGQNGIDGGTGGGAGGYWASGGLSGPGTAGTCFSGGTGGGAQNGINTNPINAQINGGKGGDAAGPSAAGGGAGNPGGVGIGGFNGETGTGGTLIVICEGTLTGTGSITSNGSAGGNASGVWGGGSGGGSITVMFGTNPSGEITTTATGGLSASSGGNGTARKLAIGAN